jgi:hypothetical protein
MLNVPPFFDQVAALLRPDGLVINASSYGPATPFFTPQATLVRGFERRGLQAVATERDRARGCSSRACLTPSAVKRS